MKRPVVRKNAAASRHKNLPYGASVTLAILIALGLGITVPVVGTMRAKQKRPLAKVDLARCEKKTYQRALPLGSAAVEVLGRTGTSCTLRITDEREQGAMRYRCSYPTRKGRLVVWTYPEAGAFWDGSDRHCVRE